MPASGRTIRLEWPPASLDSVAERLAIPGVRALGGEATIRRKAGGAAVAGAVRAELIRTCVVTLEETPETVESAFAVRFMRDLDPDDALSIDPGTDEDLVELEVETIDLADLLIQEVALAMAAYPRKPGLAPPAATDAPDDETSPFAALRSLKIEDHKP